MPRRTIFNLLAAAIVFLSACCGQLAAAGSPPASPIPAATLSDLKEIDQFQDLFNQQAGKPRLILLISPT